MELCQELELVRSATGSIDGVTEPTGGGGGGGGGGGLSTLPEHSQMATSRSVGEC